MGERESSPHRHFCLVCSSLLFLSLKPAMCSPRSDNVLLSFVSITRRGGGGGGGDIQLADITNILKICPYRQVGPFVSGICEAFQSAGKGVCEYLLQLESRMALHKDLRVMCTGRS
ncbi:hypothetical protein V8F06_005167 [Rhypophila decipiens]